MTDYDADYDGDQDRDVWIQLWTNSLHDPLTRYCLWVAILALAGWLLIQALTP